MSAKVDGTVTIAGYEIIEQLYSGSRTQVYRAVRECDTFSARRYANGGLLYETLRERQRLPVVIKLLQREYPTFSELVQFRNQYAIAKNLDISGIIKPYSLELYRNGYALVMEDFGGISLREFTPGQPLTLEQFLAIALQLIDTLHQLHQQRVIHKDIKPANILIHPQTKQIKLIDFSIASLLPRETQEIQSPNGLEGTLAYLSPEQTGRMNRGVDYRSDFYSLGVTFFELLSGQLPFESHDPMELVHCHIAKLPPFVCDFNPDLPLMLGEIVRKLMAKNAEDRYQSALGLKHDLTTCLNQWRETGKHTWFELGQRDISDRFVIPEKLYGRESEVQTLLEAFGHVANGGCELMLVAGFSGIGKTAVVNEVHKPIVRWNGYFIKGKYDQFNRNIPLSAFVQAFRDLMGQLLSESDSQLEQWQSKILAAVGENGQVLIEVIPELEQMIGKQPAIAELSGSAAQNRFNLLFQKFTQVFTTVEHPLVMFLDDLQWADSASLKLMQLLIADTGHLLLIGAYRDNEVNFGHPLVLTLKEIQKTQATVNTITLAPLSQNTVNQLVADTLRCTQNLAFPLSVLLYQKTKGNPFFATQFLKALHQDHLIQFNFESGFWQCDIAQVTQQSVTDDVVAFMAFQLQRLPQSTQQVLQLAACIGNQFDLATLAIVLEQSQIETAADLWKALEEGLILPISDVYKFYQGEDNDRFVLKKENTSKQIAKYIFLHDRVQQAAYSLIPDHQKTATHLKIGHLLLEKLSLIEQEEKLFDIVGHLNQGRELILQIKGREVLAQLNLKAGGKARNSTAYAAARVYLQTGIELLQTNCWLHQYELTLNLYVAAAEAAYLNADFEGMEQMAAKVLQSAKTILDKVKIYEIKISAQTAQSQMLEAIVIAREALLQLGVEFPSEPDAAKIGKALQDLANQLRGRQIEELVDLPVMTDPTSVSTMQLLSMMFSPIIQGMPGLMPFLSSTMVSLSLQFGNASASTVGYVIHGVVLCAFLGEVETGYSFGKLALSLQERFDIQEFKSMTLSLFGNFIQYRQEAFLAATLTLKDGYTVGMDTGDFLYAGYSIGAYCFIRFFAGVELETCEPELAAYSAALAQMKQYSPQLYLDIAWQTVKNFRETGSQPDCLIGIAYDETVMLAKHHQDNEFSAIAVVYIYKLMLAYSYGNYTAALDYIAQAKPYLMSVSGFVYVPIFHFYAALTHLALFSSTQPEPEQAEMLAQAGTHQTILYQWAQNAPMNHLHKWYLVEAERYRVLGEKAIAIECYDKAITLAKDNEFINEQSLSNELAAKFYLDWGKQRIAQDYLIEAYYSYARWGAKAKVADLEQRYSQLLAPILQQTRSPLSTNETLFTLESITSPSFATSSSSSVSVALDLATILKASQTLSGEMELEKLLSVLLHIVIENAGADKCVFMLLESGCLLIQALAQLSPGVTSLQNKGIAHVNFYPMLLNPQPVQDSVDVPVSLINTVKRSLQPAVIIDATVYPQLINDPYIQQQQPKSILCCPILHQGKLLGILYLENNLATGAFTSDRVELLNLLCAQAAISLENARLYRNSQNYAQQLTQSLAKLQASEIRFQNLTNNIPGMVYQFRLAADGSTSTPYVSSGCFDLYGLVPELVMLGTHSLYTMNHPDDEPGIVEAIAYSAQTLTPFKHEWRIILPSGTLKWIQCAARPERQADGAILWDGVVIDISDRKRIEVERQQAQKKLVQQMEMLDLASDAIIIRNMDDKISYWNQGAQRLYGWTKAEVLGQYIHTFLNTTFPKPLEEVFAEFFQTGSWEGELLHINRDGKQVVVSSRWTLQRDEAGQPLTMLEINSDISDVYDELRLRKQAEASLAKEREFLNAIIHNITDGIVVCDASGKLTLFNKATREFHGLPVESLPPEQWAAHFDLYQPDGQTLLLTTEIPLFRALQGEIVENAEIVIVPKHGSRKIVLASGQAIVDPSGNKVGAVAVMRDISERARLEAERKLAELALQQKSQDLQQALNDLQHAQLQIVQSEKMSALGNLVAGVAHEMNNPLGFIAASLKQAKPTIADIVEHLKLYQSSLPSASDEIKDHAEKIDLDYSLEDLPKMIDSMTMACDRLKNISTSLRTFSRADQDYKVPFNIHQGIDSTILILKHRLKPNEKRPAIEVITEYSTLPPVECFPGQLNQVFMNILANAIDALDESNTNRSFHEIQINPNRITIKTSVENQGVKITINDNGKGMTEEVKQKIFDHLFTTKAVGQGTGLGLAIARQIIVEKHGGAIKVNSHSGQGTEFTILLPIKT